MDRFARLHTAYLTAPEYPACRGEGCRNDHLDADGYCAECAAEMHVDAALLIDDAADFCPADEALFVGALTEADLERFAAAESTAYAVAS